MPQVDHLGGLDVDVVNINLALSVSLHGEFVEDALGGLLDTEDHDFIDELGGGLGVEVLVADRFSDLDVLAIVVVAHLSPLVVSIVMVLTIIQVKVA